MFWEDVVNIIKNHAGTDYWLAQLFTVHLNRALYDFYRSIEDNLNTLTDEQLLTLVQWCQNS